MGTTNQVIAMLGELLKLDDALAAARQAKTEAEDKILTDDIKAQLAEVDAEFEPIIGDLLEQIADTQRMIKAAVIQIGKTVAIDGGPKATYVKGRVGWDTKALAGYAAAHPEIEQFKTVGQPSVRIKL